MNVSRLVKYAEFGMYFLIGTAISVGGLVISTLSVVSIATLAKTPICLD